jgi:hypothetical protein
MDQVKACINITGHSSRCRFDDDSPRRCRANIARADRRRRIYDDRRQIFVLDHSRNGALGNHLAVFVSADGLGLRERRGLVAGLPVRSGRKRGDAAGVDDALDAGALCRDHDQSGAFDIGPHDVFGIARPEPVIGGDMEEKTHVPHGPPNRAWIEQVALDDLEPQTGEVDARAGRAKQYADVVSGAHEASGDRGTDKPARAGNEHHHGCPQSVLTTTDA